jgi:hypothetical protein
MRRLAPWNGVHTPILRNGRIGHNQLPGIPRILGEIEKQVKPPVTVLKTAQYLVSRFRPGHEVLCGGTVELGLDFGHEERAMHLQLN